MQPQSLPRKPVVTAIIRREEDGKLLLVKRSDQVGTYQQHWGGVSGGVEGNESLIYRALQEISEEVGLSPQQLQLVAAGRPLPVDDGPRRFLVFPFLFHLIDRHASVTLNWENVGFDWLPASNVPQLQHVPLLPETVRRLLLPPYMQTHVHYLKSDRQHGAAELAAYVLQALTAALDHEERSYPSISLPHSRKAATTTAAEAEAGDPAHPESGQMQQQQMQMQQVTPTFEGCMEAYRNFCFHMAIARPSMAAVANAAADVLLQLQQELSARADAFEPTAGVARVALRDTLAKLSAAQQQQQAVTITNTAAMLRGGMRIMTTSLSSTVAKALIQAHQQALAATGSDSTPQPAAAAHLEGSSGSSRHVSLSSTISAAVAAGAAEAPGQDPLSQHQQQQQQQQHQQQHPEDHEKEEDWVDDPAFWPSITGIGREQTNSSTTTTDWLLAHFASSSDSSSRKRFKGSSRGPGLSVIVCESRPLCEGVAMARRLAAAGLSVTVITDAQAGVFVEDADVVLLGADAVTPAGVINKVGSKLLVLAAKAAGVPVVAVTDSSKISPGPVLQLALPNTPLQEGEEEKEASELLAAWGEEFAAAVTKMASPAQQQQQQQQPDQQPARTGDNTEAPAAGSTAPPAAATTSSSRNAGAGADSSTLAPGGSIEVRNIYFEAVPLQLVSAVVTDKGVLGKEQVAEVIQSRAKGYQQAFGLELPADMLAV